MKTTILSGLSFLASGFLAVFAAEPTPMPPLPRIAPKPPAEAAKTFRVLDGFRMELIAAEPLVASPVAMTYDENGNAYVCEMRDYPYTDKARHKPSQENPTDASIGRIRRLEDTDGDGVLDRATIFAEDLSWPTGIACWQGGIYVAATPEIWYLKDTDGDGRADVRRRVFSGFRKLNVQAVMNNLVWGLDNRIHGAGGSNGGQIQSSAHPDAKPLLLSRHDFSFDPGSEKLEPLAGGARFGGTFDDWGHRFLCNIRNPAQHIVLPNHYLARNPFLAARSPLHDMAESGDQLPVYRVSAPEPWRVLRAQRWSGERVVMPRSELIGAGVVTSASGITSYRGSAYPPAYRGNVFVCESAANLFYRLQLTPDGPTFRATRPDGEREMVASTDNWFRPVNFVNAPDGTLHVLDMYRENIEHPWSIPEDIHAAVDLEAGRDMGRIWRLAPAGFQAATPPRLGSATAGELVLALDHPNSWWRETAQRLLFERQDKSAVPALRSLLRKSRTPQGRLHALWTLEGLHEVTTDDLLGPLQDAEPGVRTQALKLAESRMKASPPLQDRVLALAEDPDPGVRLQTAFTLGGSEDARALPALAAILRRDATDPWIRTAVLSSTAGTSDQLLARLLSDPSFPGVAELIRELAQVVGVRGKSPEMQRVLDTTPPRGSAALDVMAGLGDGLKRSGRSLRAAGLDTAGARRIAQSLDDAAVHAADMEATVATRATAIQLLAFDEFDRVRVTLGSLLEARQPQEIQHAAVTALAGFSRVETGPMLLASWDTYTPAIRGEVVLAMLGNRLRVPALLAAIERGEIPAHQVPFARRALLLRSADEKIKELATRLFGDGAATPRGEVVAKYQSTLTLKGDAARGRKVFELACAACHRASAGGVVIGNDVGPNLATIRQWNPDQILVNILDPNREVAPNFVGYLVETRDGRTLDGMIAEESAASLTLKRAGGLQETVLRRDIKQLTGLKTSLMPDGLEAAISVEQMADLLAFLRE